MSNLELLLASCLVSGITSVIVSGWVYRTLLFRVAEMEAAVAHYWDRVRKRMNVPGDYIPKSSVNEAFERAKAASLEIPYADRGR